MKKKILFIVNPISGTQRSRPIEQSIQRYLDHEQFDYEIKHTAYAGHADVLTREATAAGVDIVVAVGGDGTVNEVARAVIHTHTALAIIPRGSGNGLARHLHIPTEAGKAIKIINKAVIHTLDYGRIQGQPFFCTCGAGFDAFVSHKFAEAGKRGFITYAENTLKEGLKYKPETYTIETESGTIRRKAFLVACANASQYGNNAYIAPHASMKDGLLDLVIMKPFNTIIESPVVLFQMFTKLLPENPNVEILRCKRAKITRESQGAVHVDGDPLIMGKELNIEMVSAAFNVVVNPFAKQAPPNFLDDLLTSMSELKKKWEEQPLIKTIEKGEHQMKQTLFGGKKKKN